MTRQCRVIVSLNVRGRQDSAVCKSHKYFSKLSRIDSVMKKNVQEREREREREREIEKESTLLLNDKQLAHLLNLHTNTHTRAHTHTHARANTHAFRVRRGAWRGERAPLR